MLTIRVLAHNHAVWHARAARCPSVTLFILSRRTRRFCVPVCSLHHTFALPFRRSVYIYCIPPAQLQRRAVFSFGLCHLLLPLFPIAPACGAFPSPLPLAGASCRVWCTLHIPSSLVSFLVVRWLLVLSLLSLASFVVLRSWSVVCGFRGMTLSHPPITIMHTHTHPPHLSYSRPEYAQ